MPSDLSNYVPKNRGNDGGQASPVTAGGGYYVAPARSRGGSNDLVDAYRNLRQLQGQRTYGGQGGGHWLLRQPQQDQQPLPAWQVPEEEQQQVQQMPWDRPLYSTGQAARSGLRQPQMPAFQPPDTTGWREMTDLEKGVHGLAEAGEKFASDFDFGFGEKMQEIKFKEGSGKVGLDDYAEAVARFLPSLPFGMIGGLMGAPEKLVEAGIPGTNIGGANLQESYDGKVSPESLTTEQRLASGADALLDVGGLFLGPAGKAATSIGRLGASGLKMMNAVDKATDFAKGLSPTGRLGAAISKSHPYLGGAVVSAGEEAGQEFVQSLAEQVRGEGDQHGLGQITGENMGGALKKAGEQAIWGAIGGGAFHTANYVANYGLQTRANEDSELASRDLSGKESLAAINQRITDAKKAFSDAPTPIETFDQDRDNEVANIIARDIESKHADAMRSNMGYSGVIVGDDTVYGDYMVLSSVDIMKMAANNKAKPVLLDAIFGQADGRYAQERSEFVEAVAENDVITGTEILNKVAEERDDDPEQGAIEALFWKQPMNNGTPVKGKVRHFTANPNMVGINEQLAALANADYDGDLGSVYFDPDKLAQAKFFTETLLDGFGKSRVPWGDAYMDIENWDEDQMDMLFLMLDAEFGGNFSDDTKVKATVESNGRKKKREMSVRQAFARINGMNAKDPELKGEMKDKRYAAMADLYQQLARSGVNVSNIWRYVQSQSQRYAGIRVAVDSGRAANENAVDKMADPRSFGEHYPIQTSSDPEELPVGKDTHHGHVTSVDPEAEKGAPGSTSYRDAFLGAKSAKDREQIKKDGTIVRPCTPYEQVILANLDMIAPGRHDRSKIMSLYNRVCRGIVDQFYGKSFQFDRDFDPDSSDGTFPDRMLDAVNEQVSLYNNAIKEAFFDGVHVPDNGDVFLKKHVTRENLPEFIFGIYKDDYSLADLIQPLIRANREMENIPGINRVMGDEFSLTHGEQIDEMLFTQTDSQGETNRKIGRFVKEMHRASDRIGETGETNFRTALKELHLEDRAEVEVDLGKLGKEQKEELIRSDEIKTLNRMGELLGSDVLVACGVPRIGSWRKSEYGKRFMYGTDEDMLNVGWSMMFYTHGRPLFYRLDMVQGSAGIEAVKDLMMYLSRFNKNGNPVFDRTMRNIVMEFCRDGVVSIEGNGDVSFNEEASIEDIRKAAAYGMRFMSDMIDLDIPIDEKIKWFDLCDPDYKSDEKKRIPWFTWLRAGTEESFGDIGMSRKIAQARALSPNSDVKRANAMMTEVRNLRELVTDKDNDISEGEALDVIRSMASDVYVEVSDDVLFNEMFSCCLEQKDASEKGTSVEAVARATDAAIMDNGAQFMTLFRQNTDAIGNNIGLRGFGNTRQKILGCLFGTVDKVTGKPFTVNVYDQSIEDYRTADQKEMLGLAEDEEVTLDKLLDFLEKNPNVASWLKPMEIQLARIGDMRTVGPRASTKTLSECFKKTRSDIRRGEGERRGTDFSAKQKRDNWVTKETKSTIMRAARRTPLYKAIIVAAIKDLEHMRNDPEEFRAAAYAAKQRIDRFMVHAVLNYDKKEFRELFDKDVEDSIDRVLGMVFETTYDEQVQDSLLAEQVQAARREKDAIEKRRLAASYLMAIDPNLELSEEYAHEKAEEVRNRTQRASDDRRAKVLLNVIMHRLLTSQGKRYDLMNDLKREVSAESVSEMFTNKKAAKEAYAKLSSKEVEDSLSGRKISREIDKALRKYTLDEQVYKDEDGNKRDMDAVIETIRSYACDNEYFAVEPSFIWDEIAPKVALLYDPVRFEKEVNDERAAENKPRISDDEFFGEILAQVLQKAALEYYRGDALRRDKTFDGENDSMMRMLVNEFVPTVRRIITREIDPNFFNEDRLDKVTSEEAKLPELQWFNPVTSRAVMRLIEFNTSGDTAKRIENEGATGKFQGALGFLKYYSCEQGERMTFSKLADLDVRDQKRYVAVLDGKTAESVKDADVGRRVNLTKAGVEKLRGLVDVGLIDPAAEFVLVDRSDSDKCPTGLCRDHAQNMIEFLQKTMSFGQENRALKLKKKFRIVHDVIKGSVNRSSTVDKRSITENITPQRILEERSKMVQDYALVIRQNAVDPETEFGDGIDEQIDWTTWSVPFAKMMTSCVKVFFRNGDTCSLGMTALMSDQTRDPLYQNGMTTHSELIDWDQVESVEMRILSPEELSSHIINAIERAERNEAATGEKFSYAQVAYDAFENWDTRSRYCQETGDVAHRLTMDDIVANIGFLSSSLYDPPILNVLPGTVNRFLNGGNNPVPTHLRKKSTGVGSREGITADTIQELKDLTKEHFNEFRKNSELGKGAFVCAIETDKNSGTSGASYISSGALSSFRSATAYLAAKKEGFVKGGIAIIDYTDPAGRKNNVKEHITNAAECDALVAVDDRHMDVIKDILGLSRESNVPSERVEVGTTTFNVFNPAQILGTRSRYDRPLRAEVDYGIGTPYRIVLSCPGRGPSEDSFFEVFEDEAEKWISSNEAEEVSFELGDVGGRKVELMDDLGDMDSLSKFVDEQLAKRPIEEPADVDEDRARKIRSENRDMSPDAVNVFDFSAAREAYGDISDTVMLRRIKKYLDRVSQPPHSIGKLENVTQGDVVAIARTGTEHNYVYYPIVYEGSAPVTANEIRIDFDEAVTGTTVNFKYYHKETIADGNSPKFTFPQINSKCQARVVKGSCKLTHGDANIPVTGMLNHPSMPGRLTDPLSKMQTKLWLMVALREYVTYDVFAKLDRTNANVFFANLGNFTPAEIYDAFHNKRDTISARDREFWRALASGTIEVRGMDFNQKIGMGRMIFAFLNANTSPAFLFSSRDSTGKSDGTTIPEWMYMLADTTGVRVDDVMAFCNYVDPTFCPPDARTLTDREFIDSEQRYFTDASRRCLPTYYDEDGNQEVELSYAYATKVYNDGITSKRSVSDSVSFNDQIQYTLLYRNGPYGCDPKAAMKGMRIYSKKFSDEDISGLYEADPDIVYKKLVDPQVHNRDTAELNERFAGRPMRRSVRAEKWQENMRNFYRYYNITHYPEVWDDRNGETLDIDPYYTEARALYGGISKELYMRVIMADVNWTWVESPRASGRMPKDVFLRAHEIVMNRLRGNQLPLVAQKVPINDKEGTVKIGVGAIEPAFLRNLCNVMGLEYDAAIEQVRHNLQEARTLIAGLPIRTPERMNQETAIEYLETQINGITDTLFLEANTSTEEYKRSVTKIHDYLTNSVERDVERFDEQMKLQAERLNAINEARNERSSVHIDNERARGGAYHRAIRAEDDGTSSFLEKVVKVRQASAMFGATINFGNILDTFRSSKVQQFQNYMGRQIGVGPSGHLRKHMIDLDDEVVESVIKDKAVQEAIEARRLAMFQGENELRRYNEFIEAGHSPADYIKQNAQIKFSNPKKIPHQVYGWIMNFGSGSRFFKKTMARNFIRNFQKVAGRAGFRELDRDGVKSFERDLLSEKGAAKAINDLFAHDNPYAEAAETAFAFTLQGSLAQPHALTWFGERLTENRGWMKFIGAVCCGTPFFNATVNLSYRFLKNVVPGLSTMNYLAVEYLENNPEVFSSNGPLGRILRVAGRIDGEKLAAEFKADAQALKQYTDLREAIVIDLCHLTLPMFALVLATSGMVQPPDDDDLYDDYEEWLVFGQPVSLQWWLKDLVGPILPWACYYKAGIDGKPNSAIMLNGMCDFLNMSPFFTAREAIGLVLEPDAALETYEETKDWYADSKNGAPDMWTYLMGNATALGTSMVASIFTPKIVYEISQYMMPYEVSYNRKYAVDETGQPLYEPDGVTRRTEKVSYMEAQMRKLSRRNFLLGSLLDFMSGTFRGGSPGYTAAEMPLQVISQPEQIACMKALSVYDYENDVVKSPDEIAEVCTAVVLILDGSNDMKQLYEDGFYLDSYTKQAVSEYIWDLYQQEVDEWNALVQSGATDYYVAGEGDWGEGQKIVNAMKQRHYDILSYYKDELYYGKLRSSELNQGLIRYNRYNTTYRKDRNGDWYATGFRENMNPFFPGFSTIPVDQTVGNEGSYATISELNGLGMYDQEGDPMRALVAVTPEREEWKDWEELGGGNANGMSNSFVNWDPDALGTSGSTGYRYPRYGYRRSYGSGGRGYGGYRSYGGGYRSYGSSYVRHANVNRGQGGYVPKAPYVNTHRSTRAHNVNFNDPNFSNVLDARKIYTANLDYLRPDFETKGSREAYKRGDF